MSKPSNYSESFSEPITLFFHDERGSKMADSALNLAAKMYDLKVEKHFSDNYCINYFRLLNPKSQLARKNNLFTNSTNLVRMLVHYKRDLVSEPGKVRSVRVSDLKSALTQIDSL